MSAPKDGMSTRFRAPFKNLGWSGKKGPVKVEKKVFGVPLDATVPQVPLVIRKVVEYFDTVGVELEGLFRISASHGALQNLIQQFDSGLEPDLSKTEDPHICSSLLKQYLRDLPEPLLTFELYDCFLAAATVPPEAEIGAIKKVLKMLPLTHRITLKYLCGFLLRVSEKQHINRMTPANIAIVFAPNILKPKATGNEEIAITLTDTPHTNKLMERFVSVYHQIFDDEPDPEPEQPPAPVITAAPSQTLAEASKKAPPMLNKHRRSMSLSSMEEFNYGKPLPKPPGADASQSSSSSSSSSSEPFSFPPPPAFLTHSGSSSQITTQSDPFSQIPVMSRAQPNATPPQFTRPSAGTVSNANSNANAFPPVPQRGPSSTVSARASPVAKPSVALSTPTQSVAQTIASSPSSHPPSSSASIEAPESPTSKRRRINTASEVPSAIMAARKVNDKSSSSLRVPRSRVAGSFQPLDQLAATNDPDLTQSPPHPSNFSSPLSMSTPSPVSPLSTSVPPSSSAPSTSSTPQPQSPFAKAVVPTQAPASAFASPSASGAGGGAAASASSAAVSGMMGKRPTPPPKKTGLSTSQSIPGSASMPLIQRGANRQAAVDAESSPPLSPHSAASQPSPVSPSPLPISSSSSSSAEEGSGAGAGTGERPTPPPSRGGSQRARGRGGNAGAAPLPISAPSSPTNSSLSLSTGASPFGPVPPPKRGGAAAAAGAGGGGGVARPPGARGRTLGPGSGASSPPPAAVSAAPSSEFSDSSGSSETPDAEGGGRRRSATVAI